MVEGLKADIVIVGSGAGGATVAKELSKLNKKIYVLEKGIRSKNVGSQLFAARLYEKCALFNKSKEGVLIYRAIAVGGTTLVSCGNGVRALEGELVDRGIKLEEEFSEAERELNVIPNPYISKTSQAIVNASSRLGINMVPMPKFFVPDKCTLCGRCVLGCKAESKWSAISYIKEAEHKGVKLITNITVQKILTYNGKAIGIRGKRNGRGFIIKAKLIILCAGALGTPVILQNSGIEAGKNFFCDLLNVTYGVSKEYSLLNEPAMSVVSDFNFFKKNNFILSPFLDSFLVLLSLISSRQDQDLKKKRLAKLMKKIKAVDVDNKNIVFNNSYSSLNISYPIKNFRRKNLIGIMTKIKDEKIGKVNGDGTINKYPTEQDLDRLKKGASLAKKILVEMGVSPASIVITKPRGAHPGGSAAIGDVVNSNLETKIKGLYVCDASVFPESAGLPPILTIIALAKRMSKRIIKEGLI